MSYTLHDVRSRIRVPDDELSGLLSRPPSNRASGFYLPIFQVLIFRIVERCSFQATDDVVWVAGARNFA